MSKKSDIEAKKVSGKECPEFRVSFPSVFEPQEYEDGGKPKYQVTMLFDKDADLRALKRAAANAMKEKWGPKSKWPKKRRSPFRDGSEMEDTEGYKGKIFVKASCSIKSKPQVVDERLQPITNEEDFYAGCYARASLIAFAYDHKGNKGVSFALQNLQKTGDGEPFSGRRNAADEFDAVETGEDDYDNYDDDFDGDDDYGDDDEDTSDMGF